MITNDDATRGHGWLVIGENVMDFLRERRRIRKESEGERWDKARRIREWRRYWRSTSTSVPHDNYVNVDVNVEQQKAAPHLHRHRQWYEERQCSFVFPSPNPHLSSLFAAQQAQGGRRMSDVGMPSITHLSFSLHCSLFFSPLMHAKQRKRKRMRNQGRGKEGWAPSFPASLSVLT